MQVLRPDQSMAPAGGHGGDHRRLRRRPPGAPPPAVRSCGRGPPSAACRRAVVTFDRHPATVVRPESAPLLLTDLDQKLELLGRLRDRRHRGRALRRRPGPGVGRGLRLRGPGRRPGGPLGGGGGGLPLRSGRKGNVALLAQLGAADGLRRRGGVAWPATAASRSRPPGSAGLVAEGDVGGGRPAARPAPPGPGPGGARRRAGRGRPGLPDGQRGRAGGHRRARGRHLRRAVQRPDGPVHPAAISVGRRPTFYDPADGRARPWSRPTCSTSTATSTARRPGSTSSARLRDEQRFERVEDLVAQMHRDVAAARDLLAPASRGDRAPSAAGPASCYHLP